jgi:tetratricopeptide (TPR) repeat protein
LEEACQVFDAMRQPSSQDLYNQACVYASLSTVDDPSTALTDRAMESLRRSLAAGLTDFAVMDRDPDLDPLRGRSDFRALVLDRGFPSHPFAGAPLAEVPVRAAPPSPAGYVGIGVLSHATPEGSLIASITPGGPAARDGRLQPGDTILGVVREETFASKPLEEVSSLLRGAAGTKVRVIVRPQGTDRREVYELTRAFIAADPLRLPEALDGAILANAGNAALWFQRGDLRARKGQWQPALADFRAGLERDANDSAGWMSAAVLSLYLGDVADYRRYARGLLERYQPSNEPTIAARTARTGLLAAPSEADRGRLMALADVAVTGGIDSPALLPESQLLRGMAAYREGQFPAAAAWLQKVPDSKQATARCRTAALLYLSMAESRRGDVEKGRAWLKAARRLLAAAPPRGDDAGEDWQDWLICQIALREAEVIVLYNPIFPADPFAHGP